jgi:hypothetical protein
MISDLHMHPLEHKYYFIMNVIRRKDRKAPV